MSLIGGVLVLTTLILTIGCDSQDGRLADYAERATGQQARQNEAMAKQSEQVAKQSQELASAAHELVEQDAASRRELLHAQDQLQKQHREQQLGLDQQRQELRAERLAADQAAYRNPVIAESLITLGLILAALLPLIVAAYALRKLPDPSSSEILLANGLLDDLSGMPLGLSSPCPQAGSPPDISGLHLPAPAQSRALRGTSAENQVSD